MAKRAFTNTSGSDDQEKTLTEQVYTRLRDDIVEGNLAAGLKLRIEPLRERYKVGAGTIREALTRLVSDALVTTEGQRGFWVAPMSVADLQDLTQVRCHLEVEALRLSVQRNSSQWRALVTDTYQELDSYGMPMIDLENRKTWERCNNAFHDALISGAQSPWTTRILQTLSRQSERYRRLSIKLPNKGRRVKEEHRLIFDAAMAGEDARAALALEMHIRATPDLLLAAWRNGELDAQGELVVSKQEQAVSPFA